MVIEFRLHIRGFFFFNARKKKQAESDSSLSLIQESAGKMGRELDYESGDLDSSPTGMDASQNN